MKKLFLKELNKVKNVKQYEIERTFLKNVTKNKTLSKDFSYTSSSLLKSLIKDSSKVRLSKRCVLSNRSSGILSSFKISRIYFRSLINKGLISGLTKSSW